MHPTLLIGPYDWQPERLPKNEFLARIQALWNKISDPTCSAVIVYGDSRNHAELAYLSNFIPKLGPAMMFIPREGEPKLLVSGAQNMLAAAKRLTWVERVEPLRDAGKTIARWLNDGIDSDPATARRRAVLIGGDYMRSAFHGPFIESFGRESFFPDATPWLRTLMRCKSPRELGFIREGCAILDAATKALIEAKRAGAGVTASLLEAERVANHLGAQDVCTLFSLDGGRTLRPFEEPIDSTVDPLSSLCCRPSRWLLGGRLRLLICFGRPGIGKSRRRVKDCHRQGNRRQQVQRSCASCSGKDQTLRPSRD